MVRKLALVVVFVAAFAVAALMLGAGSSPSTTCDSDLLRCTTHSGAPDDWAVMALTAGVFSVLVTLAVYSAAARQHDRRVRRKCLTQHG